WVTAGLLPAHEGLTNEPVHLAAVDIGGGARFAVRAAVIQVAAVVEWRHALAGGRIRHAHRGDAICHRDTICSREGTEVAIEGAVLLHDHDDVLDLVDPDGLSVGMRNRCRSG